MPTLKLTGAIGLFCASFAIACAGPSSSITAPSAVLLSDSSAQVSAVSSSASSAATETGSVPELSASLGNGHGNGNGGGGNGNGSGNPQPNGNGNGNGHVTPPPTVQAPAPPSSKKVELEGAISAIAGNMLTVNGQDVVVPLTVVVHHGSHQFEFTDLKVGDRVHVRASLILDVLTASDVKLQNPGDEEEEPGDPTDGTELSVDGLVSLLSAGACPAKTFKVGTQSVQTNVSTVFAGGTCNVIIDGGHVQVLGVLQSGVLVASHVQIF
jgi:Domain of unknown function (DUF5666)